MTEINFTPSFDYYLRFTTVVDLEIKNDYDFSKYSKEFRDLWKNKCAEVRNSIREEMVKRFGETSTKFYKAELKNSSILSLVQLLEEHEPQLIKAWMNYKT